MKHVIYCLIGIVVFAAMLGALLGIVLVVIKLQKSEIITRDRVGWAMLILVGSVGIYGLGRRIGEDLLKIK